MNEQEYEQLLKFGAEKYINSMLSINAISIEIGVKGGDLRKYMEKNNIPRRACGEYKLVTTKGDDTEIIRLYNLGDSVRKIALQFNVDRDVILRVLNHNNIQIRKPTLKFNRDTAIRMFDGGASYREIARELNVSATAISHFLKSKNKYSKFGKQYGEIKHTKEVIDLYTGGESMTSISKKLKVSRPSVNVILREHNIPIRNIGEVNRTYSLNENYFENIQTPNKYLTLGIMYSDGYNSKIGHRLSLELKDIDKKTVEFVKNELETESPLNFSEKKKTFYINVSNIKLTNDLANLGCSSPKSYNLQFPRWVSNDLFNHFLHGYFIGDGWLFKCSSEKSSIELGLIGTEHVIKNMGEKIKELYNVNGSISKETQYSWSFTTHKYSAVHICNQMFKDAPHLMDRKYNVYKNFVLEKQYQINNLRYSEDREIIKTAFSIINKIDSQKILSPSPADSVVA